ncbi:LuxR family transcriptional regulator [Streptomyces sp. WAC06614]|uniref:LuxR family transcriptional regulator n=1 Tax=Streptomyces sp. WAC06614 TaxID=2487416 RepID=UPI0021AF6D75|nr:LuxR family transcriptional regulator [Streptomyces sp. WAC06614]
MREALHERGEVLDLVAAEAERARFGSGRLVLLRGATGTGRTAVLEAVARRAAAKGMLVLRARCAPDPLAPFAAVNQLFAWESKCSSPAPGSPDPGDVDAGSDHERATRLWHSLLELTEEGPLLLAVDDVHLADERSRGWLVGAARLVDRLPVLLVATERSQYDVEPPAAGLAHALPPDLVRTHTLAPLSRNGAERLVRSVVGPVPEQAWVDEVVRATAGNPLLLHALLDDLRAPQTTDREGTARQAPVPPQVPEPAPVRVPVPDSCAALYPGTYPAAVSWWLESAGTATADLARALAVVSDDTGDVDSPGPGRDGEGRDGDGEGGDGAGEGREGRRDRSACLGGDAALLAGMTGVDPARAEGWLTAMTRLGMLRQGPDGRTRYAHPVLRDAVLSSWPGARRKAAHGRAAEAMLGRGYCARTVAGQLLRASAPVGPWAADVLLDAGGGAARAGRTDEALAFLRRALDEELPPVRRSAVLIELGSLEYAADRPATGIPRLIEAVRLAREPRDLVRAALALGTALAGRGEVRTAVGVLDSLDDRLTEHQELIGVLRSASALLADRDETMRQEVYGRLRAMAARAPGAVGAAGRALLIRYDALAGLLSAQRAMERVRALLVEPSDPLEESILLSAAASVALWSDALDEAERLAERGLAGAGPRVLHPAQPALREVRADLAAARGAYPELLAEPAVRRLLATPGDGRAPDHVQALAVLALTETGRTDRAAALVAAATAHDAPGAPQSPLLLYARGRLRAASDDPAGALEDFLECGRLQSARAVVSPVVTPWRTAAAECRLALGRPEEALALAEEELRLARVWNTPRLLGRCLRVLGAATGGLRGLELAEQAVRLLRDTPAEPELLRALIAQGRRLAAAGERARAREPLREAAERAERTGARRLRGIAAEALQEGGARRTESPRTGPDALTDSERRIAVLAASGRTNAEIGDLLHLARRTVETHLTNAYRKLAIRRRAELPAALSRLAGTAAARQ